VNNSISKGGGKNILCETIKTSHVQRRDIIMIEDIHSHIHIANELDV
jgi:hypothetical protein